jgi:voltage-gated potassium channel Kch
MSRETLSTRWEGQDLVVLRNDQPIDRIAASDIRRVILVCERGDTPSDLAFALIDAGSDFVVLPADSGIAGRVHFERQAFWAQTPRVYWVDAARAPLPRALRPGLWPLRRQRPGYGRVPSAELTPQIERWPIEGPQSWEQRKWARIEAGRTLRPAKERTPPK